jgi:hypothetical protein
MPCVRFEPTIPTSEQAKTVHALDRSAIVTGNLSNILRHFHEGNMVGLLYKNKYNIVTSMGCEPSVPFGYEVGWTPEPVWTTWRRENS